MKCQLFVTVVVLFIGSAYAGPASKVEVLGEHMELLKPLVGAGWIGGYAGSEDVDIEIELRWQPNLDGKAVRYIREAVSLDYRAETQFYWNSSRGEVAFLSLDNEGNVGTGVAVADSTGIVLIGISHGADQDMEYKTTFEILSHGRLRDTFLRMENGEWVRGHVQEFVTQ